MIKRDDQTDNPYGIWSCWRSQRKISISAVDKNFIGRYKDENSSS
ncbi:MAG: hypothetical protein U9P49_02570 [Thermodesulfobacteriota bacterium]|nr:hypothetical protein [Thermodesulfobacteriota bacterium]